MLPTLSPARGLARWLWITAASVAATCLVALGAGTAQAQVDTPPRLKTESPYFFVKSDDPTVDQLPLKSTRVDVRISGVIADVTVVQRYKNEGQRAIEAKYVFPGSTRAAVYGMNVRLADRLITARIREKQQARIEYDSAKKEGKTAALLEQHLPNVFQMNVANIMPGDDVQVELRYTELLVPQSGNYQFVFPTVVGPRYNSPQSGQATAQWVEPALPAGRPGRRRGVRHPGGDRQPDRPEGSALDLARHRGRAARRRARGRVACRTAAARRTTATSSSTTGWRASASSPA